MSKALQPLTVTTLYDTGSGTAFSAKPTEDPGAVGATGRPIVTSRATTQITVEFNAGNNGITSEARYRDASNAPQWFGAWSSEIAGTQEAVTITGLTANTLYEVQARSVSAGTNGAWSRTTRFRTYATVSKAWDIEGVPYPTDTNATLTANAGFEAWAIDPFLQASPSDPAEWPSAEATGYYFVDSTDVNATDANTYGYPDAPRLTLPSFSGLAAGSVITINAGTYTIPNQNSRFFRDSEGASDNLIWVRGYDPKNPPTINGRELGLEGGKWIFLEHLQWNGGNDNNNIISFSYNGARPATNNIVLRHCEIQDIDYIGGGAGIITISSDDRNGGVITSNIILWDNYIHDNAQNIDWDVSDFDHHGIGITARTSNGTFTNRTKLGWIVDNWIVECSGNGVQFISIGLPATDQRELVNYFWVAGNRTGDSRQGGLWSKRASHVFFVENEVEGSRSEYSGGNGQLAGCQYGPDYLWYIRNRMRDGTFGIQQTDSNGYPATEADSAGHLFLIENVITDIRNEVTLFEDGTDKDPGSWRYGTAISYTNNGPMKRYAFGNTTANVSNGIAGSGAGENYIHNNLIAKRYGEAGQPATDDGDFLLLDNTNTTSYSFGDNNLCYVQSGTASWQWDSTEYTNVDSFQTATNSQFTNTTSANPLFNNVSSLDLRVSSSSPAVTTPSLVAEDGTAPYTLINSLYGLTLTAPTYIGAKGAV